MQDRALMPLALRFRAAEIDKLALSDDTRRRCAAACLALADLIDVDEEPRPTRDDVSDLDSDIRAWSRAVLGSLYICEVASRIGPISPEGEESLVGGVEFALFEARKQLAVSSGGATEPTRS